MSRFISTAVLGGLALVTTACAATDSGAQPVASAPADILKSPFAPIVKRVSPSVASIDTVSTG